MSNILNLHRTEREQKAVQAPLVQKQIPFVGLRCQFADLHEEVVPAMLQIMDKVRVYDSGVKVERTEDVYERLVENRSDMHAAHLDNTEVLKPGIEKIAACLRGEAVAVVDGSVGARVVTVLEAASKSFERHGEPIDIG